MNLEESPAFLAVPGEKEQGSHCISGNGRQTVSWAVTPKSLGEGQSPEDNSLLKDCIYLWDPYVQCCFPQAKTLQIVGFFFFVFHSTMSRISHFPHFHLHLGVSGSLAFSAASISAPVFL